jgi:hypothetical protein
VSVSDIPEKVRCLLWAKSAGRCEFDGCNKLLWRDGLTQLEMNFADVAHIIGDSPSGPRGDVKLSLAYCNDVNNLMLMCLDHHRMIDHILETYPDDVLRQMKKIHEDRMETLTAIVPDKTSHVLIYRGQVGEFQPKITSREAWLAMSPNWYPAGHPIELGFSNSSFRDNEDDFWKIESKNLQRHFNEKVKPIFTSDTERNHLSVFAFAPQPLLIKIGALLSDLYPAEVYQLHREPPNWEWQPGPEKFEFVIKEPETVYQIVALKLALSATIDSNRIADVLTGQDYSEWEITVPNPNNDFLKSRGQLRLFRVNFRSLINKIKAKHGEKAVIHIFPAVPISIAVEIGRVRQPKADLPFIVYDQNKKTGGFMRALNIGEGNYD